MRKITRILRKKKTSSSSSESSSSSSFERMTFPHYHTQTKELLNGGAFLTGNDLLDFKQPSYFKDCPVEEPGGSEENPFYGESMSGRLDKPCQLDCCIFQLKHREAKELANMNVAIDLNVEERACCKDPMTPIKLEKALLPAALHAGALISTELTGNSPKHEVLLGSPNTDAENVLVLEMELFEVKDTLRLEREAGSLEYEKRCSVEWELALTHDRLVAVRNELTVTRVDATELRDERASLLRRINVQAQTIEKTSTRSKAEAVRASNLGDKYEKERQYNIKARRALEDTRAELHMLKEKNLSQTAGGWTSKFPTYMGPPPPMPPFSPMLPSSPMPPSSPMQPSSYMPPCSHI